MTLNEFTHVPLCLHGNLPRPAGERSGPKCLERSCQNSAAVHETFISLGKLRLRAPCHSCGKYISHVTSNPVETSIAA